MRTSMLNGVALAVGVALLAAFGPMLVREVRSLPRARQLAARAGARIAVLDIGGMHCSGCQVQVRAELERVPGVAAADVRLQDGRATVVCDPTVADSTLISAVHRAGPGFTADPARN